jgi:hypothetical protein
MLRRTRTSPPPKGPEWQLGQSRPPRCAGSARGCKSRGEFFHIVARPLPNQNRKVTRVQTVLLHLLRDELSEFAASMAGVEMSQTAHPSPLIAPGVFDTGVLDLASRALASTS